MKPASFSLHVPETVEEALESLDQHSEDARVIAGGQSLIAMMNMRLTEPGVLIDITGIPELKALSADRDGITVGAAVTQAEIAADASVQATLPLIGETLKYVGHVQTRNRGTVCGSVCHADPSAELPLLLATLGGSVTLRSKSRGVREVGASDFQTGVLSTDKAADELCVSVHYPSLPEGTRHGFREISRRHGDFAIVALACVADGSRVRLGVGGVADTPVVEEWTSLANGDVPDALNELAWRLGGYDDIHASAKYRRELVRRIGKALIEETVQ